MITSAPSWFWISIERSGVRSISRPSTSFLKRTPRSLISFFGSENTWKPPLSVRIGPLQRMKSWRPPSFSTSGARARAGGRCWRARPAVPVARTCSGVSARTARVRADHHEAPASAPRRAASRSAPRARRPGARLERKENDKARESICYRCRAPWHGTLRRPADRARPRARPPALRRARSRPGAASRRPFRRGAMAPGAPETARRWPRSAAPSSARVAGRVAALKPQSAFFEALGWRGVKRAGGAARRGARAAGLLVVLDAKRGDIGSTAEGYAAAYLAERRAAPRRRAHREPVARPRRARALRARGRGARGGVFVLTRTSNPGGRDFQELEVGGQPALPARRRGARSPSRSGSPARDAAGRASASSSARRARGGASACARSRRVALPRAGLRRPGRERARRRRRLRARRGRPPRGRHRERLAGAPSSPRPAREGMRAGLGARRRRGARPRDQPSSPRRRRASGSEARAPLLLRRRTRRCFAFACARSGARSCCGSGAGAWCSSSWRRRRLGEASREVEPATLPAPDGDPPRPDGRLRPDARAASGARGRCGSSPRRSSCPTSRRTSARPATRSS